MWRILSFLDSTYERASWWNDFANIIFVISLIVGVIATAIIIRTSSTKEEYLKRDLASTKERAAETNARAEQAKLALEKYKAPRGLTAEQMHDIAEKLKPFAKQAYDLSLPLMMEDGSFLFTQLISSLHRAGWKLQSAPVVEKRELSPAAVMMSMDLPEQGQFSVSVPRIETGVADSFVGIWVVLVPNTPSARAAGALWEALKEAELNPHVLPPSPEVAADPSHETAVHIIIGRKSS